MTTSNTYTYNPSLGELVIYAYNLAGIRSTALTQEHMESARMSANLVLADWANQGVNLWAVDLVTVPLIEGQATYTVDPSTVVILDAYMRIDDGVSDPTDRLIIPVSRSEYAAYPNKEMQGFTTTFWFDRLLSPTVTLWPVPDGTSAQYLKYYRVRQVQDAVMTGGTNVEIPYLWLAAFAFALGTTLALTWNAEKYQLLAPIAEKTYNTAAFQNTEQANLYISPQLSGYWRA